MLISGSSIDRLLPEYRARHIFTTKLRLLAFAGFWMIYLYFLRDAIAETGGVAAIILASFFITWFAYHNVMRDKWLLPSFATELLCDLTAITAMIYLTGGPASPYYPAYLLYVFVAGILYTHYLAAIVAFAAAIFYASFLLLSNAGVIPQLVLNHGVNAAIPQYTWLTQFILLALFLCGIVYTVKVASFFSQQRERILERRNRELTALYLMSSTVRSAKVLREVIEQLLNGVLDGLGFSTVALLHFDWSRERAIIYTSRRTPHKGEIVKALGRPLDGLEFPLSRLPDIALQEIKKHRVIFRRELAELVVGLGDVMTREQCNRVQQIIGAKRIAVMPIVVESEALGALIGFSREPFVEDEQVETMESFSNQSALLFEAATLIDRLRRANEQLNEANQVKSEFLAAMSHELRTPLTAIIGFSELLMEGVMGEMSAEQKESLTEVLHNAADLLDLINSLLDLTKIESGKMRLDIQTFDLSGTLGRVCGTISPLVQKRGQNLKIDAAGGIPSILGDERKIGQVILNLLANANKFTPEGGNIRVSARAFGSLDELKKEPWSARLEYHERSFVRGCAEITVEDDGIGIHKDQLERVFEMFHQADGGATRSFGGTGVGLALARKFVEMHGGFIWAESELGKGAIFRVVLPLCRTLSDFNY